MKLSYNLQDYNLLSKITPFREGELRLWPAGLSKAGRLSLDDCRASLAACSVTNLTPVLEVNRLLKDADLEILSNMLKQLPQIKYLRFMDPGVGLFCLEHFPNLELQFDLGYGNMNGESIQGWVEKFGSRLSKVILSNQLPMDQVAQLQLPCEIEIPGLGHLETFYSPRKLLSPLFGQEEIQVDAASEDRPHQHNDLWQTAAGTLMYYDKDLFVLDLAEEAQAAGVSWMSLNLYAADQWDLLAQYLDQPAQLRELWPRETTRGFFRANRTDRPLSRLSNQILKQAEEIALGRVLEAKKKSHLLIELQAPLALPARLKLVNPEGKGAGFELVQLTNLQGEVFEKNAAPGLYLMEWIKYALSSSLLIPGE